MKEEIKWIHNCNLHDIDWNDTGEQLDEKKQNVQAHPHGGPGESVNSGQNFDGPTCRVQRLVLPAMDEGLRTLIQEIGGRIYPLATKEVRVVDIAMTDKYLKSEREEWVIVGANIVVARL